MRRHCRKRHLWAEGYLRATLLMQAAERQATLRHVSDACSADSHFPVRSIRCSGSCGAVFRSGSESPFGKVIDLVEDLRVAADQWPAPGRRLTRLVRLRYERQAIPANGESRP